MADAHQPVAIITGAGSGIGRAITLALAREGYRLGLVGRTATRLEETRQLAEAKIHHHAEMIVIPADVGDPQQPAVIVDRTLRSFGRADVLINNAALGPMLSVSEPDEKALLETFEVDLFGPLRLTAKLWPVFLEQGSGCVINISSVATIDPFPGLSIYAAAKAGLESLTRSIHNEGAGQGIRAFAIAPGAVETDMLRSLLSVEELPKEKTLAPEDIARVVAQCLKGDRDGEAGQTIVVPSP